MLAASSDDQGIFATDLHSGALITTFEESAIQSHTFGTIGNSAQHIFAVQAKKALFHVWGWGDKKPCYRASMPEKMTAMAFTGDAAMCFAGSVSGSIYVWQMGTGSLLRCWPAHFREVTQLLVSQDESYLVTASADASVHVYNLADIFSEATPRPFHNWSGHALAVTSLAQLPGRGAQQAIASASVDRSVRLWDVGTGKPIAARTLSEPVHRICAGPNGTELLCACGNGELRSLSLGSRPSEGDGLFTGHVGAVLSCALSADGSRAASCSEADRIRIWDTNTRQCVSQVLATRNVQIGCVQIVQRGGHAPRPPPFQPFQRLMTAPEDLPSVPIATVGRAGVLSEAIAPQASSRDFIDRIAWGQASGLEALARGAELQEELGKAKEEKARWAGAAADLYDALAEVGDLGKPQYGKIVAASSEVTVPFVERVTSVNGVEIQADDHEVFEERPTDASLPTATAPSVGGKKKKRRR